ncbi:MAG: very short patch repair endonuclease [Candidatus Thiodiazotropha sp. (ex Dulcina madagascariensis)]|nr:very short patch repair endonuclease [Candidatus Thiodiazotropha sp. (ex Dulcina madagascariensis)]
MTEPSDARSRTMRAVKSKDTTPEMIVRRLTHSMGYRYRLHRKDLPGKPDLTFASRRKIIFVHGCFWHGHGCKRGCRVPKTNTEYWIEKISKNKARDASHLKLLRKTGWDVLVVWECETVDTPALAKKLLEFLGHSLKPMDGA